MTSGSTSLLSQPCPDAFQRHTASSISFAVFVSAPIEVLPNPNRHRHPQGTWNEIKAACRSGQQREQKGRDKGTREREEEKRVRSVTKAKMPDLNSVPPSPHVLASGTPSRRQSANLQSASSPPSASVNILPSNQAAVNQHVPSQALPSPGFPPPQSPMSSTDAAVGPGPGPLRHPRPLTASELHMQLEKEQEAVVCNT